MWDEVRGKGGGRGVWSKGEGESRGGGWAGVLGLDCGSKGRSSKRCRLYVDRLQGVRIEGALRDAKSSFLRIASRPSADVRPLRRAGLCQLELGLT